jgi:hypothetical protein
MKLRIKGNSIRFRLLRGEVQTLLDKGFISDETRFSPEKSLYYGLVVSADAGEIEAKFAADRITVILPKALAAHWTESDNIGISASQGELAILIEKDLVCHGRPGDPDNADAFLPAPPAGAGS